MGIELATEFEACRQSDAADSLSSAPAVHR